MTATTATPDLDPDAPPAPAHARPVADVLAALDSDPDRGLSEAAVEDARRRHGPNALAEAPPVAAWRQVLDQFTEPVVWLLLAAAVVAAALAEWGDFVAIMAIVVMNAILGFVQQRKAESALAALRRMSAPTAKVVRGGFARVVPARDLVPGDRVELEAGDQVPADVRLVRGFGFRVTEAALTGESAPADKEPAAVLADGTPLGDRRNMAYLGTVVAGGKATGVVIATGMGTELGRLAGLLKAQPPEPTPLQKRLARLGKHLVLLCLILVAAIAALQLARGDGLLETFRLAVSLAVAAVPEGLPAVVTITLALGLQRMVRRHALIRRLASVETLGSVTVICSDKTGTLTRNEMTVREVFAGGESYEATGAGYAPHGGFMAGGRPVAAAEPDLLKALAVGAWCNHAKVVPAADGAGWQAVGDPTEAALVVAAGKAGVAAGGDGFEAVAEVPFDSDRKAMSVVVRGPDGGHTAYTKGAPEVVLGKCRWARRGGQVVPLTDAHRQAIQAAAAEMAGRALRVIGLAYRDDADPAAGEAVERELVFAGLAGMIDPPREEAKEAVRRCRQAGIRPVMITGDHPDTALAIARELRIAGPADRVVTGRDLDAVADAHMPTVVGATAVYARVTAEHKMRIVRALKANGEVVAMTGDGVNDAPAVKAADIGVAMGVTGTDVTKEASAMVLTDDNFASIVNAVEEGRGIYDNIKKFVTYLLAGNAGKLLVMFAAVLLGWPVPLLAVQILWLNLVTDGLAALALGMEKPEPGVMRRKPRRPSEPLVGWADARRIVAHGAVSAAAAMAGFWLVWRGDDANLAEAQVVAFCILGLAQLLYAFACRSRTETAVGLGLLTNPALVAAAGVSAALQLAVVLVPWLHPVFGVEAYPTAGEWGLIAGLSLVPFTAVELAKVARRRSQRLVGRTVCPSYEGFP
ncbi:MAG: cation-translocating P-type ATPase [Gemmataceae bacterium]|nr:cation-translocating P-type ATPase [Gemmataceae bacterium]